MSEDRSDTESPVGPVPGEPLHGYVNLPTNERHEEDQDGDESDPTNNSLPPPLLAKKDRSRCEKKIFLIIVCVRVSNLKFSSNWHTCKALMATYNVSSVVEF